MTPMRIGRPRHMDPGSLTPLRGKETRSRHTCMHTSPPARQESSDSGSHPVSVCAQVPGTSLQTGSTGAYPFPGKRLIHMHHNGLFGSSPEPQIHKKHKRCQTLEAEDLRCQTPRPASIQQAARAECIERPVSDTLLTGGAPVSDTSTMANAIDDDVTIYIASAGVQNAEMMAGFAEPWTLPGSNNSRYYDEPRYSERCEIVRAIAQGDRAQLVDCRGLRDPHVDRSLHRHLGTHFVNAAANVGQKGFAAIIEDTCQALAALFAWAMTQSQTGVYSDTCAVAAGTTCAEEIPHARHAMRIGAQRAGTTPSSTLRTSCSEHATSASFTTQSGGPTSSCRNSPCGMCTTWTPQRPPPPGGQACKPKPRRPTLHPCTEPQWQRQPRGPRRLSTPPREVARTAQRPQPQQQQPTTPSEGTSSTTTR